ncbi:hypothetical protein ASPWEDRAFT_44934 [Aspergillus wentii DTO 134E9]|uniref:Uncharacterized protein n=1 Tax=Aspergillus wentii DTO 134E9 TaxID=1073089 RepID=A0A1L9R7W1_ASPWE|nr:uncharacterized protein ASPWEDRAFT_44934 [Aspergillus wentii DTO 134E9]OJJ30994.1 hypothetical protein ASPWEDRAFT_44934 [Aspergillus wentii DTO 134E9]
MDIVAFVLMSSTAKDHFIEQLETTHQDMSARFLQYKTQTRESTRGERLLEEERALLLDLVKEYDALILRIRVATFYLRIELIVTRIYTRIARACVWLLLHVFGLVVGMRACFWACAVGLECFST